MERFIARYEKEGITKSIAFNKSIYDEGKATAFLESKGIKNFFFFYEPYDPIQITENSFLFRGDVGFDITTERLIPYLQAGNNIVFDSFGGDLWEGLKMYDFIAAMDQKPTIKILGSCASACTLPFLAVPIDKREMSENSRFLIHNPWSWEEGDDSVMRKTANELEKEKINIANIYSRTTGKTTDEMLALMKEERFLNPAEMVEFNFIQQSINSNLIKDDMNNEEVKEKLSGLETLMNKVLNAFKASPKNIIVQDVNGAELDFGELETEDQIADGATATIDGAAAEGEYVMASGDTYVFEAGVLTIKPAEAATEEMEALQVENQTLTEANATLTQEIQNMTAERDAIKAKFEGVQSDFTEVQTQFSEFKNQFSKTKPVVNTPAVEKTEEKKKFSFKKNN